MLDPEKKKKVERLLKKQSFQGDQAALGNQLLDLGDKLDLIDQKLDNVLEIIKKIKLIKR